MKTFADATTVADLENLFSETGLLGQVPPVMFSNLQTAERSAAESAASVQRLEQTQENFASGESDKSGFDAIDWNSNLSRVGVMAFLLFFVTILVNLYRYSMRMAAFYDSRADSLLLLLAWGDGAQRKIQDLDGVVKATSPDNYDFGKQAKNPVDQSIELAAKILDATKRRG